MLATSYPLLEVFETILIFFAFVVWIWILIVVFSDIFRRHDESGWVKVAWIVFIIVLPYLGVFVYLIAEHKGMTERSVRQQEAAQTEMDQYVRSVAGKSDPTDQIAHILGAKGMCVISRDQPLYGKRFDLVDGGYDVYLAVYNIANLTAFRDNLRKMVARHVSPIASEIDETDRFPTEIVKLFGEMGLMQLWVPEQYGGPNGNLTMMCIAREEISKVSPACASIAGLNTMFIMPLLHFGSEEQRKKFLPIIARGGVVTAIATPAHAGRRTQVWDAAVHDEHTQLLALFRCTQMILYP